MGILQYIHGQYDSMKNAIVRGDLLVANSTPDLVRLAKGTADQVLAMNGAGTDPVWTTPGTFAAAITARMVSQNRFRHLNALAGLTKTADQTGLAVNAWTTQVWGQEDFDTDTLHDNTTNTFLIVARIAGKYLFAASPDIDVSGVTTPTMCGVRFIKNSSAAVAFGEMLISIASAGDTMPCATTIINLAAGDWAEVQTAVFGASGTYSVKQGGTNLYSRFVAAYLGE